MRSPLTQRLRHCVEKQMDEMLDKAEKLQKKARNQHRTVTFLELRNDRLGMIIRTKHAISLSG